MVVDDGVMLAVDTDDPLPLAVPAEEGVPLLDAVCEAREDGLVEGEAPNDSAALGVVVDDGVMLAVDAVVPTADLVPVALLRGVGVGVGVGVADCRPASPCGVGVPELLPVVVCEAVAPGVPAGVPALLAEKDEDRVEDSVRVLVSVGV